MKRLNEYSMEELKELQVVLSQYDGHTAVMSKWVREVEEAIKYREKSDNRVTFSWA